GVAADHHNFPRTSQQTAWIRGALDAAVRALSEADPPGSRSTYRAAVADAAAATAAVDPSKPMREQEPAVRSALQKMVRAVAIATGSTTPTPREVQRLTRRNSAHGG